MRLIRTERFKYVHTHQQGDLFFDLEQDPREFHHALHDPRYAEEVRRLSSALLAGFSWEATLERIQADRERAQAFRSGLRPTTPNQYQLPDGRIFDAEESLYGARWLPTDTYGMSGIIPQRYH